MCSVIFYVILADISQYNPSEAVKKNEKLKKRDKKKKKRYPVGTVNKSNPSESTPLTHICMTANFPGLVQTL